MFQYFRDIAKRHKSKLLVTSGLALLSYLATYYLSKKVTEFQDRLKEENATRELIKKRFSQTQKDCYMTFLSFLPMLVDPIYNDINVEEITRELRQAKAKSETTIQTDDLSGKTKAELWEELKIKSLTRFFTLVYGEALMIVLLHLQLNIISRKSYLKTALKLAILQEGIEGIDFDVEEDFLEKDLPEQAFLSFSWWLLNRGWIDLKNLVGDSVVDVFGDIDLREELNMDEFSGLCANVQKSIDGKLMEGGIVGLLLPNKEMESEMLEKTNSPEFLETLQSNENSKEATEKLVNELKSYLLNSCGNVVSEIVMTGVSAVLYGTSEALEQRKSSPWKTALLLATMSSQQEKLARATVENDVLSEMNTITALDDLSASVYSNFTV
ncbi:Pex3 protein [Martiniozyma asiatica (nom. inval.)]|nr:Pex3 protein [Martiniozyma asiatica]